MRKLIGLSLIIVATLISCNSTPKKATEENNSSKTDSTACCTQDSTKSACSENIDKESCCKKEESKLSAYYFHNTRRCATCQAVEEIATEVLKEDNIFLKSINLEEAEGKAMAEKLGVSGQTLLIVCGDKKENLTNFAFLNARSNPELLKTKIKATVAELNK